jgi:HD-GYP domain-containing protein (c-di-GMP phosphodiesterase class II)
MSATAQLRLRLALSPPTSVFGGAIREVARALGLDVVRLESIPDPLPEGLILVLDRSQGPVPGPMGGQTIAISSGYDLDCYEVIPPEQLRLRLRRALRNLMERLVLAMRLEHERLTIRTLNELGQVLSGQTSGAALLDAVLTHARRALRADGGSIYLVDGSQLRLACSQNDTIPYRVRRGAVSLDSSSVIAHVARAREGVNIADLYALPAAAPYKPTFAFDQDTGYHTRSMLLEPIVDRQGHVFGVLVMVNRKPAAGQPLVSYDQAQPFSLLDQELLRSIASQASVGLENHRLYQEIRGLFDGFVGAAVSAIEARDPSTGGHSHRVAALTRNLATAIHEAEEGPYAEVFIGEQDLTELHYAAMLHDFGKVGVREQVLLKAEKLYTWEWSSIEARFRIASLQVLLELSAEQADLPRGSTRMAALQRDLGLVRRLNRPGSRPTPTDIEALNRIADTWRLPDTDEPLLTRREVGRLCIPYGTLDPDERKQIEGHVTHTFQFLRAIPWTRDLARVPDLAYAHHEKLDGSGYPRQLRGLEIPLGARLMTIADIFDAVTAGDRPYKSGMRPDAAVAILRAEAQAGRLEAPAVELFAQKRLWEGVL